MSARARGRSALCAVGCAASVTTAAVARLVVLSGTVRLVHGARASMPSGLLRVTTTTDAVQAREKIEAAVSAAGLADDKGVGREEIRSFYWWEGAVQDDTETRLHFSTAADFSRVVSVVSAAHNYDVPMIIGEAAEGEAAGGAGEKEAAHWKGVVAAGANAASLASALAASRLVACAQVSSDGTVHVKTVKGAIEAVGALVRKDAAAATVTWKPIVGNTPYLDWVTEETKVGPSAACDE